MTRRERDAYQTYIRMYRRQPHLPPANERVAVALGISKVRAGVLINNLIDKKYLSRDGNKKCAVVPVAPIVRSGLRRPRRRAA